MRRRQQWDWKRWGALGMIIMLIILSVTFPALGNSIRIGFHTVLGPIEQAISSGGDKLGNTISLIGRGFFLDAENQALQNENDSLQRQLLRSYELENENYRLTELIGYEKAHPELKLQLAKVYEREGSYRNFHFLIDRGTEAGIKKDMPVLDSRGLLGIVRESWDGGSKVQLIRDSQFAVGALIQRSGSRTVGVLEGNSDHPDTPRLINLPNDADIQIGDEVVTSGLGGLYPKGLLIGQVISIHKDEGGLLKAAWIEPAARISKVEEVFVLIAVQEIKEKKK